MVPENPETKTETSATSKLIEDAAPTSPAAADHRAASAPTPTPLPAASPPPREAREAKGEDPADGFVQTKLSPEGTQTGPERRKAGTSRGPNVTIPLRRLGLTRDSTPKEVLDAVATYAGIPKEEMAGCYVFEGTSKMNAFEVHRPLPGETELRPGSVSAVTRCLHNPNED